MYLNKSQNVSNNCVKMYPEKCQSVSKTESSQNVSKKRFKMYSKQSQNVSKTVKMYPKIKQKCIQFLNETDYRILILFGILPKIHGSH